LQKAQMWENILHLCFAFVKIGARASLKFGPETRHGAALRGSMNIDIRIKLDLFEHPKLRKLRRRLGAEGVLGLLRLWLWAAANRPDGLLRGLDADDLELASQWEGQPGELAATLCELRLLDFLPLEKEGGAAPALPPSERGAVPAVGAFRIHDWCEHQPWASRTEERSRIARQAAKARWNAEDDEKAAKKRKDMNQICSNMLDASPSNAPRAKSREPRAESQKPEVLPEALREQAGEAVETGRDAPPAGQAGRAEQAGEVEHISPPAGQTVSSLPAEQAGNALSSSAVRSAPVAPQGRAVLHGSDPAAPAGSAVQPERASLPAEQAGEVERASLPAVPPVSSLPAGFLPERSEAALPELLPPQGRAEQGAELPDPRQARSEPVQGAAFSESGNDSASLRESVPYGFRPPTFAEVELYCGQRGNGIDPRRFLDWCEARNWQAGGRLIRDWRALLRRWEQREREAFPAPPRQDFRPEGQRARAAPAPPEAHPAAPVFPESFPSVLSFSESSPASPATVAPAPSESSPALPASPTLARPAGAALLRSSRPFPGLPSPETGMGALKAASVHQALVRERDLMARMILNENRGLYARLSRDAQTSGATQPALPPEWAHRR